MELKDYLKLLGKGWLTIVIVVVIFGFLGYYNAKRSKPTTAAFVTFEVTQKPETGEDYKYDNFYNLSAASILTDQIAGLATNPNTIVDVYKKAGINLLETDVRKLAKTFRTQKSSGGSNTLTITATNEDTKTAQLLIENLRTIVISSFDKKKSDGQISNAFNISASETSTLTAVSNATVSTAVMGLIGFIVGSILVLLKKYLS